MNQTNPQDFIRLLMQHERRLYAYLLSLVGNSADAEDLLQETSIVLWDKFGEFTPDSDFIAWSFKVARFTALNFRRKQQRSPVLLSQEFFDAVSEATAARVPVLDARYELLADCIEKLSDRDRTLLAMRYEHEASVDSAARSVGKTVAAVYKALSRVRAALFDCVNAGLKTRGKS
jgi:RNA polymerase sigma-70 factor (ECF subfamily)